MPKRCFAEGRDKLGGLMRELHYLNTDIAALLSKSDGYVSSRMTRKNPWTMDEVYKLCTLLEISLEMIPEYFPMSAKGVERKHDANRTVVDAQGA